MRGWTPGRIGFGRTHAALRGVQGLVDERVGQIEQVQETVLATRDMLADTEAQLMQAIATEAERVDGAQAGLADGATVILLRPPPLPLVGVSIGIKTGVCHQNDRTLADGAGRAAGATRCERWRAIGEGGR